jgi:hypothetical protein
MSKFGIVGATALSLALAVATPAFAVGLRGVDGGSAMHVGSGGAHVGGIEVGHMRQFSSGGRYWSGYSLYAYDPDCNDFFFRHPDYQWQPSCS